MLYNRPTNKIWRLFWDLLKSNGRKGVSIEIGRRFFHIEDFRNDQNHNNHDHHDVQHNDDKHKDAKNNNAKIKFLFGYI